jgi:hypothetical protein
MSRTLFLRHQDHTGGSAYRSHSSTTGDLPLEESFARQSSSYSRPCSPVKPGIVPELSLSVVPRPLPLCQPHGATVPQMNRITADQLEVWISPEGLHRYRTRSADAMWLSGEQPADDQKPRKGGIRRRRARYSRWKNRSRTHVRYLTVPTEHPVSGHGAAGGFTGRVRSKRDRGELYAAMDYLNGVRDPCPHSEPVYRLDNAQFIESISTAAGYVDTVDSRRSGCSGERLSLPHCTKRRA